MLEYASNNPHKLKSGFVKGAYAKEEDSLLVFLANNKHVIKGSNGSENWIDYRLTVPALEVTSPLFQVCERASRNFGMRNGP